MRQGTPPTHTQFLAHQIFSFLLLPPPSKKVDFFMFFRHKQVATERPACSKRTCYFVVSFVFLLVSSSLNAEAQDREKKESKVCFFTRTEIAREVLFC